VNGFPNREKLYKCVHLRDRVAIVKGGNGGVGERVGAGGTTVVVTARNRDKGALTAHAAAGLRRGPPTTLTSRRSLRRSIRAIQQLLAIRKAVMDTNTLNEYLFADLVTRWATRIALARGANVTSARCRGGGYAG